MLAENLVEPYKQGQNTPSKPLLTIESKSDEERAEQIPPEINSSAGLESGSPELDEDYDLKSEDETMMKILLRRMKNTSPNVKDRKSWKLCKMKWIYQLRSCSDVIPLEELAEKPAQ
jgi:hypothetical protein